MSPATQVKNPPPPTLKILLHDLQKQPPTPFVFAHLQQGYHFLLLQGLNEELALLHMFSHGNRKPKIFTNINKWEKKERNCHCSLFPTARLPEARGPFPLSPSCPA